MYATLRLFRLNPIFERDFVKLWVQLSNELKADGHVKKAILHKESKISYISYLQWGKHQDLETQSLKEVTKYRVLLDKIKECCNSTQVLHRMEVLSDKPH